jgi:SAM-dependent methyltransferase
MLARANTNRELTKLDNVRFIKSSITDINLQDACADCVVSNCVVNLVPENEKPIVFKEMFRLLRPGGRVAISDILAKKAMPEHIRQDIALYVGCIAGASQVEKYHTYLHDAGFLGRASPTHIIGFCSTEIDVDIEISDTAKSINVYKDTDQAGSSCCATSLCCDPSNKDGPDQSVDFDEWAGKTS